MMNLMSGMLKDLKKMRKVKDLSKEEFPFDCDINICKNNVTIASTDKEQPVAVSIQNQNIADNFRILFDLIWNLLEEREEKGKKKKK